MAEKVLKYLGVRNWGKYQEQIGRRGDARRPFVKMSTSLDSDPDYSALTFFERQVLDGCRRLIGLHGQNLLNDPAYIARGLCAGRKDRPHVPHAVRTLTARGFLIPTNQKDPFSQELNETKLNEKNETLPGDQKEVELPGVDQAGEEPTTTTATPTAQPYSSDRSNPLMPDPVLLPGTPKPKAPAPPDQDTPAARITKRFHELTKAQLSAKEAGELHSLLDTYNEGEILEVMEHALLRDGWWAPKIRNFGFFYKHFSTKLVPSLAAAKRGEKVEQPKAKATAPGAHGNFSGYKF
ncbi:MAG TPA: hypothetical protein VGS27_20730 [Candidatus Sulfotelmatobacter sp.]|nr:hypothetical protein [Candidatus Sulfotelmatobacter sp.]